jgi:hypothetical protein
MLLAAALLSVIVFAITGAFTYKPRKKTAVSVICALTGAALLMWMLSTVRISLIRGRWQSRRSYRKTLLGAWNS